MRFAGHLLCKRHRRILFRGLCTGSEKKRGPSLPKTGQEHVPSLRRRLKNICSAKLSHPKTSNLCDRLLSPQRDAKKLFTFLKRPGMPPTNNHAERALRGPVISRKISFGSRSDAGAQAFAILASLLGTARRQKQHALTFLHTLFTANIAAAQAALYKNSA